MTSVQMISQSKWSTSPNDISPNDPSPIDPSPINPSLNDSGPGQRFILESAKNIKVKMVELGSYITFYS